MRDAVRLFAAVLVLTAFAVGATWAAGTIWAVPFGVGVAVVAVWMVFREDHHLRDLQAFERRERLRDERERRAA